MKKLSLFVMGILSLMTGWAYAVDPVPAPSYRTVESGAKYTGIWYSTSSVPRYKIAGDRYAVIDEQGRLMVNVGTGIAVNVSSVSISLPADLQVFVVNEPTVTFNGQPQPVYLVMESSTIIKNFPSGFDANITNGYLAVMPMISSTSVEGIVYVHPVISTISVVNFPTTQTVDGNVNANVVNVPTVTISGGAIAVMPMISTTSIVGDVNVGNFPATQAVTVGNVVAVIPAITTMSVVGDVNIGNLPTNQNVTVSNTSLNVVNTPAITTCSVVGAVTVQGNLSVTPTITTATVSGSVDIGNFPATQNVAVTNVVQTISTQTATVGPVTFDGPQPVIPTITTVTVVAMPSVTFNGAQAVIPTITTTSIVGDVSIGNFPATQNVAVTNNVSVTPSITTMSVVGDINIGNLPATQNVAVTNIVSVTPTITTTSVTSLPAVTFDGAQPVVPTITTMSVVGSVSIGNFPSNQDVTVKNAVVNIPSITTMSVVGDINIGNFPVTQNVAITGQPIAVTPTISTVSVEGTAVVSFNSIAQPVSIGQAVVTIPSITTTSVIGTVTIEGNVINTPTITTMSVVGTANVSVQNTVAVTPTITTTTIVGTPNVNIYQNSAVPSVSNPVPARLTNGTDWITTIAGIGINKYIGASIVQNVINSDDNSSTSNLNAGATFTGTGESTLGVGALQINFKADQPCTIQVQQSIDNTNWDIVDSYTTVAGNGDARTFQATAEYFRVLVTNNGGSPTTYLRLGTELAPIIEVLPRALSQKGNLKCSVEESVSIQTVESTNTYSYVATALTGTGNLSLGAGKKGKSYTVRAYGGSVTYNINGGNSIELPDGDSDSEEFLPFLIDNPTINVTALDSGATAYLRITGGTK